MSLYIWSQNALMFNYEMEIMKILSTQGFLFEVQSDVR